tara:strand:+ start:25952 stop:27376 length:1425 start_codon:yes stop_codon:yes gene_type:complete
MKKLNQLVTITILFLVAPILLFGQHNEKPTYEYPKQKEVLATLENWQDLKFGLFMHWGTYSQWGIVESWSLCPEDRPFTSIRPDSLSYFEYVKAYENLQTTFNPVNFNPDKWAKAAEYAGMKYVVFTTKHHDGFNMFDTQQSAYKITSDRTPFSSNPKANVTKEIYETFGKRGFMTGAYYSISDWNHNDFWWDYFPPLDRHLNYSPEMYPEKWERFNDFIYNQLEELVNGDYGKLGMLWFDLCTVSKEKTVDWPRFEKMIRSYQPGAMMVARHTYTIYENYRTPEQSIPDHALDYPWETCMTMGKKWSYDPNEIFKPTHELIQKLVQIVSRGGNFLLNVGPGPDGDFHPVAYERLKEIGDWMQINGEGIYGTKAISPYYETQIAFTKKDKMVYAFYLPNEGENIPSKIFISSMQPKPDTRVYSLGVNNPLEWEENGEGFVISIPDKITRDPLSQYALAIRFENDGTELIGELTD